VPEYLEVDHRAMKGRYLRAPKLSDVPYPVQMEPHLVVEFSTRGNRYSPILRSARPDPNRAAGHPSAVPDRSAQKRFPGVGETTHRRGPMLNRKRTGGGRRRVRCY